MVKKFRSDCMNLDDQAESGKLKNMDSELLSYHGKSNE